MMPRFLSVLCGGALRRALRFARRKDGSMSAEAVIIFPLLLWTLMAGYVFF